jgi:hypothetical protein
MKLTLSIMLLQLCINTYLLLQILKELKNK